MGSSVSDEAIKEAVKNGAVLLDVRTPEEFKTGSVKGAKNIPLQIIQSKMASLDKNATLVVFCRSGNRSGMAKSILEANGFKNVINAGGLSDIKSILEG
ncbi:MAG: rhodanese-like domain-containing protein [Bacteroidia bacterium]|nr:rhodanese-like domain-containing protein [Bacteroidia bacterium]